MEWEEGRVYSGYTLHTHIHQKGWTMYNEMNILHTYVRVEWVYVQHTRTFSNAHTYTHTYVHY